MEPFHLTTNAELQEAINEEVWRHIDAVLVQEAMELNRILLWCLQNMEPQHWHRLHNVSQELNDLRTWRSVACFWQPGVQ